MLVTAILLIVAFQWYWLNRLYKEEWQTLKKETNGIFRDVVYRMQVDRFKNDTLFFKQGTGENLFVYNAVNAIRKQTADLSKGKKQALFDTLPGKQKVQAVFFDRHDTAAIRQPRRIEFHGNSMPPELAQMLAEKQMGNVKLPPNIDTGLLRRMSQSGVKVVVSFNGKMPDSNTAEINPRIGYSAANIITRNISVPQATPAAAAGKKTSASVTLKSEGIIGPDKTFIRMISSGKSLNDTLPRSKMDSIYRKELSKAGIPVSFTIRVGKEDSLHRKDTATNVSLATSPATVGFTQTHWYQAVFDNPTGFLLRKISLQLLFSVFLVAFTSLSLIFLYRNLVAQRKLTEMKNDFISNITHELKTPLATVSVAVEALRNFGGIQNPERTKEYLDISAGELQRLSLLVDKVLKLSLFENKELELKKENFDLKQLVEEVLNSMKLQLTTHKAKLELELQGNYFIIHADRLHVMSVVFNLLDNALKYSRGKPDIIVRLHQQEDTVILQVQDHGMGIPADYRNKIFDKFFRVPTGDHHNIKGYGLGLSYVAHVVNRHNGTIAVDSEPGKGSVFTIKLPLA